MTTNTLRQAQDLARTMWRRFYVDEVPDFKLSDDLECVAITAT